jgi:alpha-beta hydrolase superfamily lysophospholipase
MLAYISVMRIGTQPITSTPAGTTAPSTEETLAVGGLTIHLEHFQPTSPARGALVMIHGYSSHSGIYRHVAGALSAVGFFVTQYDCRGHGRSQGRRGHVARFAEYVDDLEAVVGRTRALAPDGPLGLMGHSHGATIALDAVLSGRISPDHLVVAAPFLGLAMAVPVHKRAIAPLLSALWPTVTMQSEIPPSDVCRNLEVVAHFEQDPLLHHVATPRWFQEARAAQARIQALAARLHIPTLLLMAGVDRIVSNSAVLAFAQTAGACVDVRRYEGLYHELWWEPERAQVIADTTDWLCARAPTPA